MSKQPEAMFLAELLEQAAGDYTAWDKKTGYTAAAELRKQHEVIQRLLRERNINLEAGQRDTARIAELSQQRDELLEALRNVYEVWAGSEAFEPVTAAEGYLLQLVKQMRDAAMEGLK